MKTQERTDGWSGVGHSNGAGLAAPEGAGDKIEVAELLDWLVPDLKITLAGLDGAPEAVATAVVQLLPFGSRASLISLGLAKKQPGDQPCAVLELTPLAYQVMAAAAAEAEADLGDVDDWLQQARDAADFGD